MRSCKREREREGELAQPSVCTWVSLRPIIPSPPSLPSSPPQEAKTSSTPWGSSYRAPPEILHGVCGGGGRVWTCVGVLCAPVCCVLWRSAPRPSPNRTTTTHKHTSPHKHIQTQQIRLRQKGDGQDGVRAPRPARRRQDRPLLQVILCFCFCCCYRFHRFN